MYIHREDYLLANPLPLQLLERCWFAVPVLEPDLFPENPLSGSFWAMHDGFYTGRY